MRAHRIWICVCMMCCKCRLPTSDDSIFYMFPFGSHTGTLEPVAFKPIMVLQGCGHCRNATHHYRQGCPFAEYDQANSLVMLLCFRMMGGQDSSAHGMQFMRHLISWTNQTGQMMRVLKIDIRLALSVSRDLLEWSPLELRWFAIFLPC